MWATTGLWNGEQVSQSFLLPSTSMQSTHYRHSPGTKNTPDAAGGQVATRPYTHNHDRVPRIATGRLKSLTNGTVTPARPMFTTSCWREPGNCRANDGLSTAVSSYASLGRPLTCCLHQHFRMDDTDIGCRAHTRQFNPPEREDAKQLK